MIPKEHFTKTVGEGGGGRGREGKGGRGRGREREGGQGREREGEGGRERVKLAPNLNFMIHVLKMIK